MQPGRLADRPVSWLEFVSHLEPHCIGDDDDETERLWLGGACVQLAGAGESLGYERVDIRRSALAMLREGVRRLEAARSATDGLSHLLQTGVIAVLVAGSAARGEATATSDIDFNVYVSADYMRELHSRRDAKARTPSELLRNFESRLRERIEADLRSGLWSAGYDPGDQRLTIKPFAEHHVTEPDDFKLALLHLLNLLFGATPVYGAEPFGELLGRVRADPSACCGALLGRIAMLRCRGAAILSEAWVSAKPRLGRSEETGSLHAFHSVAACVSAVIALALDLDDPQMPYWHTLEEVGATVEPETRNALGMFLARVTLTRAGVARPGSEAQQMQALETVLAQLPVAVDALIDHLAAGGADGDVISVWERVAAYLADPLLARDLAKELGLC